MLITCFFVQIPLFLIGIDLPLGEHYKVYSVVLLASVVVLVGFMQMTKKLQVASTFSLALLLMAGGFFLLITQAPSYWMICVAGILFFGGFNFMEAKMPAMVSSVAPAGQKGSAMGIYASHQFFGAFLGGLISGLMNSYFEVQTSFIICLVMIFICSLITRGLASTERVKRVTLMYNPNSTADSINSAKAPVAPSILQVTELADKLRSLAGVKDVTADLDEMSFYLKVDAKQFNLSQAQALLQSI
jgi:MFS family permease